MPKIRSLESLSKEQLIEIIQQEHQATENQSTLIKRFKPTNQLAIVGNGDPELINHERPRARDPYKDAARYRWLRDICGVVEYKNAFGSIGAGMLPSGKKLDNAIDTEMENADE